jgi:hypothetical protein
LDNRKRIEEERMARTLLLIIDQPHSGKKRQARHSLNGLARSARNLLSGTQSFICMFIINSARQL